MDGKKIFYSELAYLFGIFSLASGTAMMERADYGMSMVVAPAYLLHLKFSQYFPAFSFGMAEYCLQAVILLLLAVIIRKIKIQFFFSFLTAVFYGVVLDGMIRVIGFIPILFSAERILFFVLGMVFCSVGVSLLFHTYITPEAYELFVKEVADKFHKNINKTKTVYDCCSLLISVIISFLFFGLWHFEGVKVGTLICALFNGTVIGLCSKVFDCLFEFKDRLPFRTFFER